MKAFRDIRIIPVVLVAILGFAVLKITGLVLDGGYVFDDSPAPAKRSWAESMLNFPTGRPAPDSSDVTGSVGGHGDGESKSAAKPDAPPAIARPVDLASDPERQVSASERAILERLQARRQELDQRAREIDIRESLLKAAEKRLDSRAQEVKSAEAEVASAKEQKSEADAARFKGIVTMYESMKPKDAARVFDRLEMPVLLQIASKIAPRKMSDILGQMSPDTAERLTVELARSASGDSVAASADLPKIEGRPQINPVQAQAPVPASLTGR